MMMGQQKNHPVIDDIAPRLNNTLQDGLRQIKDEIQSSQKASLSINTGLPLPVNQSRPKPVKPVFTPDRTDIVPVNPTPTITENQIKANAMNTIGASIKRLKVQNDKAYDEIITNETLEAIRDAEKTRSGSWQIDSSNRKPKVQRVRAPTPISSSLSSSLVFADSTRTNMTPRQLSYTPRANKTEVSETLAIPERRGRGRPAGSRNRSKEEKDQDFLAKQLSSSVLTRAGNLKP